MWSRRGGLKGGESWGPALSRNDDPAKFVGAAIWQGNRKAARGSGAARGYHQVLGVQSSPNCCRGSWLMARPGGLLFAEIATDVILFAWGRASVLIQTLSTAPVDLFRGDEILFQSRRY